jgi:hypothetical protein
MSVQTQQIHRRKSSKDEEEIGRITTTTPIIEIRVPEEDELPSVTLWAPPHSYQNPFNTSLPWPSLAPASNVVHSTWSHVAVTIDILGSNAASGEWSLPYTVDIYSLFACFSFSTLNIVSGSSQFFIVSDNGLRSNHVHIPLCTGPDAARHRRTACACKT